jgi:hypothetical protein
MYQFNDQPNRPRNPRRGRGFFGFPWWLFFVFFWVAPAHLWWMFLFGGLVVFVLFMVARSGNSPSWMRNSQQYNQPPYQQPYYQPSQPPQGQNTSQTPYYQPTSGQDASQASYYQPYQQGYQYQPPAEEALSSEGPYKVPAEPLQEEYDQPKAEYPQQMPPM